MSSDDSVEVCECLACECRFESGVADPGPDGQPRCPQCGLLESVPAMTDAEERFVVRRTTRFR